MSRKQLFEELLGNFVDVVPDVIALIISDLNGLVIASKGSPNIHDEVMGALSTTLQPMLGRLQEQFSFKNFGTASFDTDEYRLIFVDTTKGAICNIVLDSLASVDKTFPFAYLLAEKVALIMEDKSQVQTSIPMIGMAAEENDHVRLKNNIYALRLRGGEYKFKFIIIGDAGVGKTSLILRFVENRFQRDYRATIGLNVLTHSINLLSGDQTKVHFSIFDIGSQKYFQRVRRTYYSGAHAAFVVFDLTSRESFENLTAWKGELDNYVGKIPFCVIGNKLDLVEDRAVAPEEGIQVAEEMRASYMETSAKEGTNVEDAFSMMAYKLLEREMQREEATLMQDISEDFKRVRQGISNFTIGIGVENRYFNPVLSTMLNLPTLEQDAAEQAHEEGRQVYAYPDGFQIKSTHLDTAETRAREVAFLAECNGIVLLFQEKPDSEVAPWRQIVTDIVHATRPGTVIMVGIKTREADTWLHLTEQFQINQLLEENPEHSVFFFRLSQEYRLELLDNFKTFFDALEIQVKL